MTRKMTSIKALKKISGVEIFEEDEHNIITDIDSCCVYKGDLSEVYEREVNIIKKDLYRLKKLKKENQELKEKVNHFEKVIEVMQNPSKLDCTHMFDNCKELKPLTEKKKDKITSLEALKSICNECEKNMAINKTRCPFRSISNEFCEEYDLIKKELEILESIKKWSFIEESYKEGYGPYTKFQCIIHTIGMEEDFKKIKEWLEK